MNALRFLVKYSWIVLLPIALVAFIPLALNASEAGGIPAWGYWMLSLIATAAFFVSSAASGLYSWYVSKGQVSA
jgi:hypothetical protein